MSRMRFLSSVLLTLLAVEGGWQATWTPHADNVSVVIVIDCDRQHPFRAVQRFEISPSASTGTFYRPETPEGSSCLVSGYVMRNPEPLNPEREYQGEATVFTLT